MRSLSAVSLAVLMFVSGLIPASASAWCRMTTSPRDPTPAMPCVLPDPTTDPPEQFLEWRRPCSAITISATASSMDLTEAEVLGVLARSIATWGSVTCDGQPLGIEIDLLTEQSTCGEPLYRDGGANVNTVMFIADWGARLYDPAAFAVTTVFHRRSTGEILDVDMELNERRGPYGICPDTGCLDDRLVDLENVVTHEMGHYLGIAHSTDPTAAMFASSVAGETIKRDLGADDIEGVCTVYPAGVPPGECDPTPRGGLRLDCEPSGCSVVSPRPRRAPGLFGLGLALAGLGFVARRRQL